jgi:hypothetical protein
MDTRLATLKAVFFYLPHNVSTLNQCRKLSCGTVVCKHFACYQGYPNYCWVLIWYAKGQLAVPSIQEQEVTQRTPSTHSSVRQLVSITEFVIVEQNAVRI